MRGFHIIALTGLFALASGCRKSADANASAAGETVKAARRPFTSAVSAVGAVKPQVGAEVRVGARISGRVDKLHANIKDQVRKGQVIAELEKAELQAAVARQRADVALAEARLASLEILFPREVEKAEADVARWQATVTLATKDMERQQSLLTEKITSQEAADEAQEKLAVTNAQLESARKSLELLKARNAEERKQARAELESAKAQLTTAEVQLSYASITAPISGVVGSVSTQEGETVAAGLNAPTFVTIIDLSRLMVEAYVDEVDIGKVQLGQRAVFTVDAFPSVDFEGKVVAIYPKASIQDNVVKYTVALDVTTPYESKLRPEMTATVTVQLEARTVLAIPSKAVQREAGRNIVYVAAGGRPQPREVKLGWKDGPWTEVASGLSEGEEVFIELPKDQKEKL